MGHDCIKMARERRRGAQCIRGSLPAVSAYSSIIRGGSMASLSHPKYQKRKTVNLKTRGWLDIKAFVGEDINISRILTQRCPLKS